MKKNKLTHEDALDYLEYWIRDDDYDYLRIIKSSMDAEMMAANVVELGDIDPDNCAEEQREIEEYIIKLAKKYRKLSKKERQSREDLVFKGTYALECEDCGQVSFFLTEYDDDPQCCLICGATKVVKEFYRVKSNAEKFILEIEE